MVVLADRVLVLCVAYSIGCLLRSGTCSPCPAVPVSVLDLLQLSLQGTTLAQRITNALVLSVTSTTAEIQGQCVRHCRLCTRSLLTRPTPPVFPTEGPGPAAGGNRHLVFYSGTTALATSTACLWVAGPSTCTVTGLTPGTAYTLRARIETSTLNSVYSNSFSCCVCVQSSWRSVDVRLTSRTGATVTTTSTPTVVITSATSTTTSVTLTVTPSLGPDGLGSNPVYVIRNDATVVSTNCVWTAAPSQCGISGLTAGTSCSVCGCQTVHAPRQAAHARAAQFTAQLTTGAPFASAQSPAFVGAYSGQFRVVLV